MSIFNLFTDKKFADCECCVKPTKDQTYYPVFGVGELDETCIWCTHARPIKFTQKAIEKYELENTNIDKNDTDEKDKTNFIQLENTTKVLNKTVGVVRRKVKNGIKTDEFHCPKYKLLEIQRQDYWAGCTVKIQCITTHQIEEKINISRVVIPKLIAF
tara:strand:+ start:47 stop:520 length:474 start_codon:yes stop_codon:yes gene_type:complete